MTNLTTLRYEVKEVSKFGMFFGFKIWDNKENAFLPFDFDEEERYEAESKCELKNALNN
jgi:hypothetical protein